MRPEKIISGGQTGADRAGLEAARQLGIPTGGLAPRGWRVCWPSGVEGTDPTLADFGLVETAASDYAVRTRLNAQNSCGTVWFGTLDLAELTLNSATAAGKPTLCNPTGAELRDWVAHHQIKVLNVAGNRAGVEPAVYEQTFQTLMAAFGPDLQ